MLLDAAGPQTMIAGYFGAPYTYPSDVHIANRAEQTDLTLKRVGWDGKPFKSPIYYGVRIARWGQSNRTATMVDFTHSKTISDPAQDIEITGLINGAPVPLKAKIGALFKHLEFRLNQTSLFIEYKFTFADYLAPLTRLDGNLLVTDLWRQFQRWRSGAPSPGGTLATQLTSHQIVTGAGYRFGR